MHADYVFSSAVRLMKTRCPALDDSKWLQYRQDGPLYTSGIFIADTKIVSLTLSRWSRDIGSDFLLFIDSNKKNITSWSSFVSSHISYCISSMMIKPFRFRCLPFELLLKACRSWKRPDQWLFNCANDATPYFRNSCVATHYVLIRSWFKILATT